MEMLNARVDREQTSSKSAYFLDSLFFTKLYHNQVYNYKAVKRWKMQYSIFDYDRIFVPINNSGHWTLAVCDFQKEQMDYYDSLAQSEHMFIANHSDYFTFTNVRFKVGTIRPIHS